MNNLKFCVSSFCVMLLLMINISINAQDRINIKGRILDENESPLPGANVVVKGTTIGTTTDESGTFEIGLPSKDNILQVSYIGYLTEEISFTGQSNIEVTLLPDLAELDEIVVIGYGTVKKSDLTGSVASVTAEDLENIPQPGINRALQGKAPGVQVMAQSGSPGAGTAIRIRGTGSMFSNNDPLFVIDGVPIEKGSGIEHMVNPSDIERVEVLKDASAAAIYGSRGANGVILVTTKRGKIGKPTVVLNAYAGVKNIWNEPDLLNATEYVEMHIKAKENAGQPINTDFAGKDPSEFGEGTDWWDVLTQPGEVQNYDLSITGGSENFSYATSINYFWDKGVIKKTDYQRIAFRLNTDYKVSDRIKFGTNLSISNNKRNTIVENSGEGDGIARAYQLDPITPVFKTREEVLEGEGDPTNPWDWYNDSYYTNRGNLALDQALQLTTPSEFRMLGNAFGVIEIIKGLSIRSEYGLNIRRRDGYGFSPEYWVSASRKNDVSSVSRSYDMNNNWVWNNILTYTNSFGKHDFTLMGAYTAEEYKWENLWGRKEKLPGNTESLRYLIAATQDPQVDGQASTHSLISYLERLNYSFGDKYLLTGSIRRDGSSRFATGYKWGTFSSYALAWRISNEDFFRNVSALAFISELKLRAGWGQLGNQEIVDNAYVTLLAGDNEVRYPLGVYPNEIMMQGYAPETPGNPTLQWETQEQTNIGFDVAFLNNRWTITADYFIRRTLDNLLQVPTPDYVGLPGDPYQNAGEIENKGIEIASEFKNTIGNLQYSVGGNISFFENKIISLADGEPIAGGNTRVGYSTRSEVGHPISEFYGWQTDGIFQNEEEVNAHVNTDGNPIQRSAQPGDFRFKDIDSFDEEGELTGNPDGIINDADKVYLGSPHPDFVYAFNFSLAYKGFDFSAFFQGQYGNKIFMYEKYFSWIPDGIYNVNKIATERAWDGEGTSNNQPRISAVDRNQNFRMSDWYLSDGSYMRLKHLQIGYMLPQNLTQFIKVSGMRIYVSAENLFTITKYEGLDPEVGINHGNLSLGMNQYVYPLARTFMGGIKITL